MGIVMKFYAALIIENFSDLDPLQGRTSKKQQLSFFTSTVLLGIASCTI